MKKKYSFNYLQLALKIIALALSIAFVVLAIKAIINKENGPEPLAIVLSAHPGDAELALGGMLSQQKNSSIIAEFFTNTNAEGLTDPKARVKNFGYSSISPEALADSGQIQSEISQDIQALISANGDNTVSIYAPAYYGTNTNPDNQVLYQAYLDVAATFPNPNVNFYFYENYPQAEDFTRTSVISLRKFLENETGLVLENVSIPLLVKDLNGKQNLAEDVEQLKALSSIRSDELIANNRAATQKRCGAEEACEVVYKIKRY